MPETDGQIDPAVYKACITVIAAARSVQREDVTAAEVAEFWTSVCEARRLRANKKAADPEGPAATE